jgi:hemophore-related protein
LDTWSKELPMMFFRCTVAAAGVVSGAMLFGAPVAGADPNPAPVGPNCTAADMAQVATGVAAATSVYLFEHPDVNDFFTSLKGTPRSDMRAKLQQYMDANPQAHADLEGIRQPMKDFRARCQVGDNGADTDQ